MWCINREPANIFSNDLLFSIFFNFGSALNLQRVHLGVTLELIQSSLSVSHQSFVSKLHELNLYSLDGWTIAAECIVLWIMQLLVKIITNYQFHFECRLAANLAYFAYQYFHKHKSRIWCSFTICHLICIVRYIHTYVMAYGEVHYNIVIWSKYIYFILDYHASYENYDLTMLLRFMNKKNRLYIYMKYRYQHRHEWRLFPAMCLFPQHITSHHSVFVYPSIRSIHISHIWHVSNTHATLSAYKFFFSISS